MRIQNHKDSLWWVVTLFVTVFLLSCAQRKTQPTPAPEETVDTLKATEEEPVIIFEEIPPKEITPAPEVEETEKISPAVKVYGFRVQIFASSTEQGANKFANRARAGLSEPVYVEYVSPYWKVRVGDFSSRTDAENYRDRLRNMGYPDAFVVETVIKSR